MLESFFIHGALPPNVEKGEYSFPVIALSYVIASFASYIALSMAQVMVNADHPGRRFMHIGGAFALGIGIWAMHFIGMLAYKTPMSVEYDPFYTLISMFVAIVVAYGVLAIVGRNKLSVSQIVIGAVLLGFGICAMHYTGMAAMQMDADLRYVPGIFLASLVIAIATSGAALWIAFTLARHSGKHLYLLQIIAALIMGIAICGMHYTGMAASAFIPHAHCKYDPNQTFGFLTLCVAGISSIILGITLIFIISNRNQEHSVVSGIYAFPTRLLAISMILTVSTMIWMGGNNFYIHYFISHDIEHDQKIAEFADQIIYLEGVRAQSVRSTATGDAAFDKRYYEALTTDLEKKIVTIPDKELQDIALNMDSAGDKIANLERQYLQLVEHGKIKEAEQLIHGNEYNQDSELYMDNKRLLSEKIRQALHTSVTHLESNIYTTLMLVFSVISVLIVTWFFLLRSINRWRTELQQARKRAETEARTITLLRSIAATSNQAADVEKAVERIIQLICEFLEWPIGHAYVFATGEDVLLSTDIWFAQDEKQIEDFKIVTRITPPERGKGLAGRVWETKDLVWITDIKSDPNFRRIKACPSVDIKSGFAFPVMAQNNIAYVLEFFNTVSTETSENMRVVMKEAGDQLTQVIERVYTQGALEQARASAEAANVAKSDFLANMSHELRTPLNSILGMLRLLKEYGLNEEQSDLVSTAFNSSVNLLEIVNDILDLSKIEANEVELERIGFDLQYVFHSVLMALAHLAKEKKISLTSNCNKLTFPYVIGDPTRFGRVLINLVSNAIKYTDIGHVEVNVMLNNLDEKRIELYCTITDTGIGIPKEKRKSIFEKFVQADTSTTRKYGGTGLGLAITKQLVELMGGTIGVESEVGRGSVFWFRLPFEVTDTLTQIKESQRKRKNVGIISPQKVRVLIAEDHPLNQLYIQKLMKKFAISHFELVSTGNGVIKRYNEAQWDIILMDCHMPEKNGYDTTIEIRNLERLRQVSVPIPIIAMTANAMVGDKEKCLRCGMDDYVSKPIDMDGLKEVLAQWIHFDADDAVTEKGTATAFKETAVVDLSQLRTFIGEDKEAEKEFIQVFVMQSEKNIIELGKSCSEKELGKIWQEAAHMFKGGAGGIGAESLRLLCDKAQHLDLSAVEERAPLFQQIKAEYQKVKDYLMNEKLI